MRVTLVLPPESGLKKDYLPSIGVGHLAAWLRRCGHRPELVDAHAEGLDVAGTATRVLAGSPGLVGIGGHTGNRLLGAALAGELRGRDPGLRLVAGGVHFGRTAADALARIPALDAVVRGEGEHALAEICARTERGEGLAGIAGVTARDAGGAPIAGPDRPFEPDLDRLGAPAWDLYPLGRYRARLILPAAAAGSALAAEPAMGVASGRGCPYDCVFCANGAMWGRRLRLRSPAHFVDEVETLHREHAFRAFDFWNDTFSAVRSHAEAVCDEIERRRLELAFYCMGRVNTVSADLLARLRRAGCAVIGFGVESGSDRVLRAMRKGITVEAARRAVRTALAAGLLVRTYFILGNPEETPADVWRTLRLMDEMEALGDRVRVEFGLCVVFPGADLEARARSEGSIVEGFSWNAPFPRRSIFAGPSEVLYEPPAAPLWAIKVLTLAAGRTSLGSAARAALRRLAAAAERTFTAPNR